MRAKLFLVTLLMLTAAGASGQTIVFFSAPSAVGSGLQSSELTARLSTSQHGGVFVSIATSDSTIALVASSSQDIGHPTASNYVANGATDARFVVQGLENTTGTVDVTVSAPGFADAVFSVDVTAPAFRVVGLATAIDVPDPDDAFYVQTGRLNAGGTSFAAVEPLRVGGPGGVVTIGVSDAGVAELVTTALTGQTVEVTMVGGEQNSPTSVAAGGVAFSPLAPGPVDVAVTMPGFTPLNGGIVSVTVGPGELGFISMPAKVGAGLITGSLYVTINGSAHGGTTLHLTSLDSTRVLLSGAPATPGQGSIDLIIPNGSTNVQFWAHGLEGVSGLAGVSVVATGYATISDGIEVVVPGTDITGLTSTIDTLDQPDAFYVRIGVPGASNLTSVQNLRPGSPGVDVALICDNPAVGQLVTTTATNDTVVVRIEAGQSNTPTSVAAGGVGFDGVGLGTAGVRPVIAGFNPTAASFRQVTVSQPGIGVFSVPVDLGAGLQAAAASLGLGASAHGGVTARVEVAEPDLAVVSAGANTVGAAAVDLFVANGTTSATFVFQGVEGATGTVHFTVTAPGFTAVVDSFEVVTPVFQLVSGSLPATIDSIDPPDAFYARVGVANGANSLSPQALRAGSAGVAVTATVDNPALARLVTLPDTSGTVVVQIAAGSSSTPTSVASGGMAFDGLAPGVVQVTASAPGFTSLPSAVQSVTVTPPTLTVGGAGDVGAGLQGSSCYVQLSGSAHGGTTVHLEVSDPGLALLSLDTVTPGQPALDFFVLDGSVTRLFYVQGLDNVVGTVSITATAAGFTGTPLDKNIVQPALDISSLGTALDVNDPDDTFRVRVGLPSASNSSLQTVQTRRPGASPLVATIVCSDPAVGNIVTLGGSAGSGQVEIAAGSSLSPVSVAAGGCAVRGVGPGTTLVSATIPGFLPMGAATVAVDVTLNGIALLNVPAALGAGLQTSALVARLNTASHGGVTVMITTDSPGSVLVTSNPAAAGTDTLVVALPNGLIDVPFHLQALEGVTGVTTVRATALGFDPGNRALNLVAPGVVVSQLADSLDVAAPNDVFVLEVGVPAADNSGLARTQVVRAGAAPAVFAVSLDDGTRADLVTATATGDTVAVAIQPGQFQSAGTVAGGGVSCDGFAAGPVVVTAAGPGYAPTTASSWLIVIFGDYSAVDDLPAHVFALAGNHPNPFNPATTINFSLAEPGDVRLEVFDVRGRRVRTLVAGRLAAGPHDVLWDGNDNDGQRQATGVYLVRLQSVGGVRTSKMTLVK